MATLCGEHAPTTGEPCKWRVDRKPCRWHGPHAKTEPRKASAPRREDTVSVPPPVLPDAIASHDLRELSWWIIREVVKGTLDARPAAVAVSAARILLTLGPEGAAQDEALREAALRGAVMNGIPPRDEDEWALAEAIFEPDALAMIRRWKPLGERHHRDVDEPRILGNLARNEAQPPRIVNDED